jgi:hypothetical protein
MIVRIFTYFPDYKISAVVGTWTRGIIHILLFGPGIYDNYFQLWKYDEPYCIFMFLAFERISILLIILTNYPVFYILYVASEVFEVRGLRWRFRYEGDDWNVRDQDFGDNYGNWHWHGGVLVFFRSILTWTNIWYHIMAATVANVYLL